MDLHGGLKECIPIDPSLTWLELYLKSIKSLIILERFGISLQTSLF